MYVVVVGAVERKEKKVIICEKEEDIRTKEEEIAGFACRPKGK